MYAVVESGGKQYRVSAGDVVKVEKLSGNPGEAVEFGRVLAISGEGGLATGAEVAGAKVTGVIQEQDRGPKTIVFKFKRKKQYKRTIGHRQAFTAVKISEIVA